MISNFKFYVYVLYRPWNMVPCYVGKGTKYRMQRHFKAGEHHSNRHLANIFKKANCDLPHKILFETDNEDEALAEEIRLIALYGRKNLGKGTLCNLTDGGDGITGLRHSEEFRQQKRREMLGNTFSVGRKQSEERKAFSVACLHSPQSRLKRSITNLGHKRCLGHRHTEESKQRMRGNTNASGKRDDAARERMSKASLGRVVSQEARKKISQTLTGVKKSPESIAKRTETRRKKRAIASLNSGSDQP